MASPTEDQPMRFRFQASGNAPGEDGTRRRSRLPSPERGPRPFTNRIDQLLGQAKPPSIVTASPKSTNMESDVPCSETDEKMSEVGKGKLYGIGPLPAPVLSSTRTSDLLSNATNSPAHHPSKSKLSDFAPLSTESDTLPLQTVPASQSPRERNAFHTPRKAKLNVGKENDVNAMSEANAERFSSLQKQKEILLKEQGALREILAEQGQNVAAPLHVDAFPVHAVGNRVTFDSPVYVDFTEASENDMLKYYSQLSPGTRRKELDLQKQALLLEQAKLKGILSEQERLLRAKQEQLHQQQEIQRHRLQFFQETGYFPALTEDGQVALSHPQLDPPPTVMPISNVDLPHDEFTRETIQGAFELYDHASHPVTEPRNENAHNGNLDRFEEEMLTESMENLRFLTRHEAFAPSVASTGNHA